MTKHIRWSLCILALWASLSCASQQDTYEYLPEIPIPALRKIIGEYAHNLLAYRVKSFTNLPFGDKRTDQLLLFASITCIPSDDFKQHMIMTPGDKQPSEFHLMSAIPAYRGPGPMFPQSNRFMAEEYQPFVRYKQYKNEQGEDSLSIIFSRLEYYALQHGLQGGKYDLLEAAIDNKDKKANQALKTARFDE